MKTTLRTRSLIGVLSLTALCGMLMPPDIASAQSEGVEELTRGPVHEAFAESISYDPEPGLIVDREAPRLIEEMPPDQRPVGDNISWIPGYWGWDEDRTDFIWISGVWRNIPPGRQWVPGYWNSTGSRWQWISGYWALTEDEETAYLPPPPKSVENGPSSNAPSDNHIWVSGNWQYAEDRYAWRPGYWEPAREHWIWVPAHYRWTPRGYIFIDGYWDYEVDRRGMIFAPVHFGQVVYARPGYYYTPVTVIALNVFARHLFVRPHYSHYYFGDYYEPRYRDYGYYASFHYHRDRRGYDPFYAHDHWYHRNDHDWDRRRTNDFDFYRDNKDARPPRTLAALMQRPENERRGRRDDFELARPLSRVIEDKDTRRDFVKVDRKEAVERSREIREFSRERGKIESRGDRPSKEGDKDLKAIREKAVRSPVASRRIEDLKGDEVPPRRPERREETSDNNRKGEKPGDPRPGGPTTPEMTKKETPGEPGQERGPQQRDRKPDAPGRDRREPGQDSENNRRPEMNPSSPKRDEKADPAPTKREPQAEPTPRPMPKREPEAEPTPRPTPKREPQAEPTPKRESEKRPTITPPQPKKEVERREEPRRQETRPQQRPSTPEKREVTPQPQRKAEPEQQRKAEPQPQRKTERPQATPKREDRQEGERKKKD